MTRVGSHLCVIFSLLLTGGGAKTTARDTQRHYKMLPAARKTQNKPKEVPYKQWADKRVLFIYAHIDDMEGSSGGLISLLNGKSEVYSMILTNSNKGCSNELICANATTADIALIRQNEQFNSAAILGIPKENFVFLNYDDCLLNTYLSNDLEQQIVAHIRKIQPHVVLTWDPTSYYDMIPSEGWGDLGYHPDHQISGE